MMENMFKSVCGLDCKECPAYIAMITDDNELRTKTAKEWSKQFCVEFSPESINCVGCRNEGIHGGYCGTCPVRKCALEDKKVDNCFVCADSKNCKTKADFEASTGFDVNKNFQND